MIAHAEPTGRTWLSRLAEPRSIAIAGIALGVFAVFLGLPPIAAGTIWWPLGVGFLGVAAGIWGTTRGETRAGVGAVIVSLAGCRSGCSPPARAPSTSTSSSSGRR